MLALQPIAQTVNPEVSVFFTRRPHLPQKSDQINSESLVVKGLQIQALFLLKPFHRSSAYAVAPFVTR